MTLLEFPDELLDLVAHVISDGGSDADYADPLAAEHMRGFFRGHALTVLRTLVAGGWEPRKLAQSEFRCSTCGGPYDPVERLAEMQARERAFVATHPRLHCPACRKRASPRNDAIDAAFDRPSVAMLCHHCGHRWQVEREQP